MKPLRLRIAWLMTLVAFAALDLASIRAVIDRPAHKGFLLGLGVVPMANVLVAALLLGGRDPGHGRFVLGFEGFGVIALTCYIAAACLYAKELVVPYISLVHTPLMGRMDRSLEISGPSYITAYYLLLAAVLSLPSLGFALIGGWLTRTIHRRGAPGASSMSSRASAGRAASRSVGSLRPASGEAPGN